MKPTRTFGSIGPISVSNDGDLVTWWHSEGAQNTTTQLSDEQVRQSPFYRVKIYSVNHPETKYDSFTYISIPRSGMEKYYSEQDGAEYAFQDKLTLSWNSFLYHSDVWVEVQFNRAIQSIDDIQIRPTQFNFKKVQINPNTVAILVPYNDDGFRFSVESRQELVRSDIGQEEPRNALLLFAESRVTEAALSPSSQWMKDAYFPLPGKIDKLNEVKRELIYFKAGIYYMPSNYHAVFSPEVKWVYLAPGAYVKGAFEFTALNPETRITGFGVLSGEKYEYEADRNAGYRHKLAQVPNCHGSCLKMLQFNVPQNSKLTLAGITVANPPYHSIVAYLNQQVGFQMKVNNYKMVGGWYWQTDGMELQSDSQLSHSFIHSNDDVIKAYHDNLSIRDLVVWKGVNGPVFQFGWGPRNISKVVVDDVNIIHNRMSYNSHNSCVFNSARNWNPTEDYADTQTWVQNLVFKNIFVDGAIPCVFRIYANSNLRNFLFENVSVGSWTLGPPFLNEFKALMDRRGQKVTVGNETQAGEGIKIHNFKVGGQLISKWDNTWQSNRLGQLDFDGELFNDWNCW